MTAVVRDQLEFELFARLFDEPLETPPPDVAAPEEPDTLAHVWIVAAEIKVEDRIAKTAGFRAASPRRPGPASMPLRCSHRSIQSKSTRHP
ncbi:hypothetical protein ABZV80_44705 [Streptomyces sp. NPDC005132]|uniref:hypothetical protein n=1 Tax=Streptomyces sp. NPDC005132 TaxID=3154294 RepID=UPI0033B1370F